MLEADDSYIIYELDNSKLFRVDVCTQNCADHKMAQKPQGVKFKATQFCVYGSLCTYVAFSVVRI